MVKSANPRKKSIRRSRLDRCAGIMGNASLMSSPLGLPGREAGRGVLVNAVAFPVDANAELCNPRATRESPGGQTILCRLLDISVNLGVNCRWQPKAPGGSFPR